MTDMDSIQSAFSKSVCSQISLVQEGLNRYRVFTPFYFDDGDHLAIVLKKDESGQKVFSDEGHTLMHISYDMEYSDLMLRNRFKIIRDALSVYMIEERDGELVIPVPDEEYGGALYNFIQGLLKIILTMPYRL